MRITKIKLSGFKSFVDPITLTLSKRLTGVVGPNGCGKSNIVDAVLWVMGESSAKHLRGNSMADVIFNGSNARKPVGQACVEIVLDNSDGEVGGQYAGYSEISIQRRLERDGISHYSLNGTRCRRRDITDIFLGTGLGARGYSVIEQGMISRIIEAKPEDMRAIIEEAAGISKYKERRRETENRIRNTQDNLSRLNDLIEEIEKQLNRLQRQARAAERFQRLEQERARLELELTALRWRALQTQAEEQGRVTQQRNTELEKSLAGLRAIEVDIERERVAQHEVQQQVDEVQRRYYTIESETSRLEQTIQHHRERGRGLEQDIAEVDGDLAESLGHKQRDERDLKDLIEETGRIQPESAVASGLEQARLKALGEVEASLQGWQVEWDDYNRRWSDAQRGEQVEQTNTVHLEQATADIHARIQVLEQERQVLASQDLGARIAGLQDQFDEVDTQNRGLAVDHETIQRSLQADRDSIDGLSTTLDEQRTAQQTLQGRLAAMEALQHAELGKDQDSLGAWLQGAGLTQAPRLAETLAVDPGWERALEVVLAERLNAIGVDALDAVIDSLASLHEGAVCAIDTGYQAPADAADDIPPGLVRLSDKVECRWPIEYLLRGVYAVESWSEALASRARLGARDELVTAAGDRVGAGWVRISRGDDQAAGVLGREREIGELKAQLARVHEAVEQTSRDLEEARTALHQAGERDKQSRQALEESRHQLTSIGSDLARQTERLEESQTRSRGIADELDKLRAQQTECAAALGHGRDKIASLRRELDDLAPRRAELEERRGRLQALLTQAREQWQTSREHGHTIALRLEAIGSRRTGLEQALQRNQSTISQVQRRTEELAAALAENNAPIEGLTEQLQQILQDRVGVETELSQSRQALQAVEARMREAQEARGLQEQHVESARSGLEQARLDAQAIRVRLDGIEEQLQAAGGNAEQVLGELTDDSADIHTWQGRLEAIGARVRRLGPINLAAIDEYQEIAERKDYLDQQHADLTEALSTLTEAMEKIDRETRTRFKHTFEKVNTELQALFPQLFGGGQACLEMTGADVLDSGVSLMARPPGKRNSSIQLLSGGEKALTALALVFAIFRINLSPFCLLDEVDASLDDANVVRFCDLLQSMSEEVQFVFVSHNKITMEIADQLIGVTMQEAGVSRLVAVDMEKAVEMAATG